MTLSVQQQAELDEVGPSGGQDTTPRQSRMKFALLLLVDLLGMTLIGALIVFLAALMDHGTRFLTF
jgi:hypothetical protein